MGRKSKYMIEWKIEAVFNYKSGKRGACQICNDLGIRQSGKDLYKWIHRYEDYGEVGFLSKSRNKIYTKELKKIAIDDYLVGKGSYNKIEKNMKFLVLLF